MKTPSWLVTKDIIETVIDDEITGQNARNNRIHNKISLRKLAKQLGISAAYLSDLELGRRHWTASLAEKVETAIRQVNV